MALMFTNVINRETLLYAQLHLHFSFNLFICNIVYISYENLRCFDSPISSYLLLSSFCKKKSCHIFISSGLFSSDSVLSCISLLKSGCLKNVAHVNSIEGFYLVAN